MDLGLGGMAVLVTGAAGGIGRAIALAFEGEGAQVAWHGRRPGGARPGAFEVVADLRDSRAVAAAAAEARERFGRLDVCIANAGVRACEGERLRDSDDERIRETIEVNLLGSIWTARAFLAQLTPREDGRGSSLLFIGSTAGRFGERGWADYAASKAALSGLMLTLKNEIVEIDPRGRVNLLEPGWTATHVPRPSLQDHESVARVVRTMPLRQIARADDIARAAVWLSSPLAARHVSGQTVTVAGGMEGRVLWERAAVEFEGTPDNR